MLGQLRLHAPLHPRVGRSAAEDALGASAFSGKAAGSSVWVEVSWDVSWSAMIGSFPKSPLCDS